jgi:hypothetical protein
VGESGIFANGSRSGRLRELEWRPSLCGLVEQEAYRPNTTGNGRSVSVNPYDPDSVAIAIGRALSMPLVERRERHKSLFEVLSRSDVQYWAAGFRGELEREPAPFERAWTGTFCKNPVNCRLIPRRSVRLIVPGPK